MNLLRKIFICSWQGHRTLYSGVEGTYWLVDLTCRRCKTQVLERVTR